MLEIRLNFGTYLKKLYNCKIKLILSYLIIMICRGCNQKFHWKFKKGINLLRKFKSNSKNIKAIWLIAYYKIVQRQSLTYFKKIFIIFSYYIRRLNKISLQKGFMKFVMERRIPLQWLRHNMVRLLEDSALSNGNLLQFGNMKRIPFTKHLSFL